MPRPYFIFKNGRLRRKENNILLELSNGEKRYIPVEDVNELFLFGEIDLNTKAVNFLGKQGIVVHFFNYYGWYTGSFYPRESLISGKLLVEQVKHYVEPLKRLELARAFVDGGVYHMLRNLVKREGYDKEIDAMRELSERLSEVSDVKELMTLEANIRKIYFSTWERISSWNFEKRERKPPTNPMNALISFGNSMLYATIVKEIYNTQLNPSISYLHEPFERRFSLSLDVAEIFKPLIVDRVIFRLINRRVLLEDKHFDANLDYVFLNEEGKKIFVADFRSLLETKVRHRKLKRKVSYRTLIRLELYKLIKHLLGESKYKPLKAWW